MSKYSGRPCNGVGRSTVELKFHSDSSIGESRRSYNLTSLQQRWRRRNTEARRIKKSLKLDSTSTVRSETTISLRSVSSCEMELNPYLLSTFHYIAHKANWPRHGNLFYFQTVFSDSDGLSKKDTIQTNKDTQERDSMHHHQTT
jgi:hypothetical protein